MGVSNSKPLQAAESVAAIEEGTVLAFLQEGELFDVTALFHGSSLVSGKRKRGEDEETSGEKNEATEEKDEEGDRKPKPFNMSDEKFRIVEWDVEDLRSFLRLANDDIAALRRVALIDDDDDVDGDGNLFDDEAYRLAFCASLKGMGIMNEPTLDSYLGIRFAALQRWINKAAIGDFYFGEGIPAASREGNPADGLAFKFGVDTGPDSQIDFSFQKARPQEENMHALVGWENKVSWNYPGGKLTSTRADFCRLGRDVSLVEIAGGLSVVSAADAEKRRGTFESNREPNATEGEVEVNAPTVDASTSARAASLATAQQPTSSGTYTMKHDAFPPRQIVSYMLSCRTKYAVLSTGYRLDFCKLEVGEDDDGKDDIVLHVAGPFWSVAGMNPLVQRKVQRNERGCNLHYYRDVGVRKYGLLGSTMAFYPNQNAAPNVVPWSTDMLEYPFLEGLCRFVVAALGTVSAPSTPAAEATTQDNNSEPSVNPRSYLTKLPSWWDTYIRANRKSDGKKNQLPGFHNTLLEKKQPFQFSGGKVLDESIQLLNDPNDPYWKNCEYLEDKKREAVGLTMFGPLSLADLVGEKRQGEAGSRLNFDSWFTQSEDDATVVGLGRIGKAYRKKIHGCDLVCKVLLCGPLSDAQKDEMIEELRWEMRVYHALRSVQGGASPRFVYAGSLVDASQWVCPSRGEIYGLATTWAGQSLDTNEGVKMVEQIVGEEGKPQLLKAAKEALSAIHEAGVLHGDIELWNIVCDGETIRFVDFGNADIMTAPTGSKYWKQRQHQELLELESLLKNEICL